MPPAIIPYSTGTGSKPSYVVARVKPIPTSNLPKRDEKTQLFDGSSEMFSRWPHKEGNGPHTEGVLKVDSDCLPPNKSNEATEVNCYDDRHMSVMRRLTTDIANFLPTYMTPSPRSSFSCGKRVARNGPVSASGHSTFEAELTQVHDKSYPAGYMRLLSHVNSRKEDANMELSKSSQGSLITIFALWNVLMGTSLLCLPWAIHQAGIIMGSIILLLMTWICYYTANMILVVASIMRLSARFKEVDLSEFCEICRELLGNWAARLAMLTSFITLWGAVVVYWILMSNFLFHVVGLVVGHVKYNVTIITDMASVICPKVNSKIDNEDVTSTTLNLYWTLDGSAPIMLSLLMAPLISIRSPVALMKFNAYGGTFSITCLLSLAAYKAWYWGLANIDLRDRASLNYLPFYKPEFFRLIGILSLALFIHNCIINFMSVNARQEKNSRDVGVAYGLVGVTYSVIGLFIYLSFPMERSCIEDNFLNNFEANDMLAFLIRFLLLIQLMSLYPTLLFLLRTQTFATIIYPRGRGGNHQESPLIKGVPCEATTSDLILFNGSIVVSCILAAIYFPQIGTIIRFCGAIVGLVYIFTLPPVTYIVAVRQVTRDLSVDSSVRAQLNISLASYILLAFIIILGVANCIAQFLI